MGAALPGGYAQYGIDDHSNIPRFDAHEMMYKQQTNMFNVG